MQKIYRLSPLFTLVAVIYWPEFIEVTPFQVCVKNLMTLVMLSTVRSNKDRIQNITERLKKIIVLENHFNQKLNTSEFTLFWKWNQDFTRTYFFQLIKINATSKINSSKCEIDPGLSGFGWGNLIPLEANTLSNLISDNVPFLYPLKTSENQRFVAFATK